MNNILDLSKKLIEIPSEKGNNSTMQNVLDTCKKELSEFTIEEFEKNKSKSLLIYNSNHRPKKFKIILNAHLDVIPASPNQYSPQTRNGRLYGRGSYDMKAPAAVEILLFKELARKVKYPFGLQIVTDEEIGGFLGTKYQIEQGIRADFVIAGEPTDLAINNEAKGIIWIKITFKGASSHAAYPWNGKNAVLVAQKFMDKLIKAFPIPKTEEWSTTINVSSMETPNKTFNKIPEECIISLDIRYIPGEEKTTLERVKLLLPKDAQMQIIVNEPSHFTNKNNPYIENLAQSVKKLTKKNAEIVKRHGGSDIRFYNQVGNEGITFGPIGAGHHTENEWVDIKSLQIFYDILKNLLLSINSI